MCGNTMGGKSSLVQKFHLGRQNKEYVATVFQKYNGSSLVDVLVYKTNKFEKKTVHYEIVDADGEIDDLNRMNARL